MADKDYPVPKQSNRSMWRLIGGAVLAIVVIAFVVDNTRTVTVGYVVGDFKTRLIWVLIVTVVIGIVLGVIFDRIWMHRRNR